MVNTGHLKHLICYNSLLYCVSPWRFFNLKLENLHLQTYFLQLFDTTAFNFIHSFHIQTQYMSLTGCPFSRYVLLSPTFHLRFLHLSFPLFTCSKWNKSKMYQICPNWFRINKLEMDNGFFILKDAACRWIDPNRQMLLATCTCYPWLDTERKRSSVFALFVEALIIIFQIKLSFIQLQL